MLVATWKEFFFSCCYRWWWWGGRGCFVFFCLSQKIWVLATAKTRGTGLGCTDGSAGTKTPEISDYSLAPLVTVRLIATFEIRREFYSVVKLAWTAFLCSGGHVPLP